MQYKTYRYKYASYNIIIHYICVFIYLLMLGLFLEGILALPLAAGLSWEICFEGGLTELSEELGHRGTTSRMHAQ